MGDRANVVVTQDYLGAKDAPPIASHEAVFLYSHWGGSGMPEDLRCALILGRDRWTDGQYLARILADEIGGIRGISTRMHDGGYDLLVIVPRHPDPFLVRLTEDEYRADGVTLGGHPRISLEDYVAASERTWDNLTDTQVAP